MLAYTNLKSKPVISTMTEVRQSELRSGRRHPDHVKSVVLRMGNIYRDILDDLCDANDRSRRAIVEILVEEAYLEYLDDSDARITPL